MESRIETIEVRKFLLNFRARYQNSITSSHKSQYVRVGITSSGYVGLGEVSPMPGYSAETQESIVYAIEDWLAPQLIGLHPFDAGVIEARLMRTLPENWYAKSALDLALWDLRAKLADLPMTSLMGGQRQELIPIGAVIGLSDPKAMAEDALVWQKRGACFFQCKIAADADSSVARILAIRATLGPRARIAVDGNGSFTVQEALKTASCLEKFDIQYFEQPVQRHDLSGMAMLVRGAPMPVVADESVHSAHDAMRFCEMRAASGFNVKLSKSGISESKKIISIAEAAGLTYGVGTMFETRFGTLAAARFASTLGDVSAPAELIGPWMVDDDEIVDDLKLSPHKLEWIVSRSHDRKGNIDSKAGDEAIAKLES